MKKKKRSVEQKRSRYCINAYSTAACVKNMAIFL